MTKTIHVAVAVILVQGRILIAKRPEHLHKGGYWEFPGGKREETETIEEALIRECEEELAITPLRFRSLKVIDHQYPEKKVKLDVWLVEDYLGVPKGLEGQPIEWCPKEQLDNYRFPEANLEIISLIAS